MAERLVFRPVGPRALLVEVGDVGAAQATYRLVRRLSAAGAAGLQPPRDVVPAARTVLLDGVSDPAGWRQALTTHIGCLEPGEGAGHHDVREVVLAVRYDGPDLDVVASAWGCDVAEVVRRHVSAAFTVAFCGFAPGFAYCTSDLSAAPVPRRAEPRASVPAGSVALAGEYCGVYPRTMPGGWQLIGSCDEVMFDPRRDDPALLRPGDTVRFEAAS